MGLPGSGKSTLADSVTAILRERQQSVRAKYDLRRQAMRAVLQQEAGAFWRMLRLFAWFGEARVLNLVWQKQQWPLIVRFMANSPTLIHELLDCTNWVDPPAWISRDVINTTNLLQWWLDVASYYQLAQETLTHAEWLLLEEGFCQHAYYLFAFQQTGLDLDGLQRYVERVPPPDLLVWLEVTPEICEHRMQARRKGVASDILAPLTVAQRHAILQERFETYAWIAEYFEQRGVCVIRVPQVELAALPEFLQTALASVCA